MVENEKAKAINDFITGYKTNFENLLKGYLRGLYLSSGQKCPSIEIYTISKLNISDDLVHRRSSDSDFWKIMKFEWPYQDLIFISPPFILFYDPRRELSSSHKLLIDKERMDPKFYGSIEGATIMESREFIAEYYRSFALLELLNYYLDKGKYLNIKMENIINKRLRGRFKHIIAVQQEVFKNSIRIDKFVNEYENLRARLPGYWKKGQLEMKQLKAETSLADFLLDSIDLKKNLLQGPYKLIRSHADRFLESKNIQVNYRLQKSLQILSAILLIAAIIQIVVALKIDFRVLFHKIAYALHNLF